MAMERREILFELADMHALLKNSFGSEGARAHRPEILPKMFDEYRIIDALHTRSYTPMLHDKQAKMRAAIDALPPGGGIIFHAMQKQILTGDNGVTFIVPEADMLTMLIDACRAAKIVLPREGRKKSIARDLSVGLEVIIMQSSFELED